MRFFLAAFLLGHSILLNLTGVAYAEMQLECPSGSKKASISIVAQVQEAYKKVSALQAEFIQRSSLVGFSKEVESEGNLRFKRPGKMRWEYVKPRKQTFVSNDEKVWFYEPELEQVTVASLDSSFSSEIPVSFLLGIGSLKESFNLISSCTMKHVHVLILEPKKEDGALRELRLGVDVSTYLPRFARITDVADSVTSFELIGLKPLEEIEDDIFFFEIPDGIDVIER